MKRIRMGILGAGNIANSMAEAMKGLSDRVIPYGVASRSLDKAETFAARWGFEKAYGSYEELVEDPEIDLIYVATPHSHHFAHATLCVEHGKPVLVEKAFTGNMPAGGAIDPSCPGEKNTGCRGNLDQIYARREYCEQPTGEWGDRGA